MSAWSALSLDPGGTTGYCLGTYDPYVGSLTLKPGEVKMSPGGMYEFMKEHCARVDHVIYEDFQYRNHARMGLDLTPVKIIGVIEVFAERYRSVTFYKQSAAAGKAFYSDERLKDMDIYPKGIKHGRDAMRHMLQWAGFGAGGQYIRLLDTPVHLAR